MHIRAPSTHFQSPGLKTSVKEIIMISVTLYKKKYRRLNYIWSNVLCYYLQISGETREFCLRYVKNICTYVKEIMRKTCF